MARGCRGAEEVSGGQGGGLGPHFGLAWALMCPKGQNLIFEFWKNKNMGVMPNSYGVPQYF